MSSVLSCELAPVQVQVRQIASAPAGELSLVYLSLFRDMSYPAQPATRCTRLSRSELALEELTHHIELLSGFGLQIVLKQCLQVHSDIVPVGETRLHVPDFGAFIHLVLVPEPHSVPCHHRVERIHMFCSACLRRFPPCEFELSSHGRNKDHIRNQDYCIARGIW